MDYIYMENNLFNNDEIYSKSGDEADIAFGTTYLEEQNSIKNAMNKARPESQPNFEDWDGETCVDYGCELPEFRIKNKLIRCVKHQEELEKRQKLGLA